MGRGKEYSLFAKPFLDIKNIGKQERYKLLLNLKLKFSFGERSDVYNGLKKSLKKEGVSNHYIDQLTNHYSRSIYVFLKHKLRVGRYLDRDPYNALLISLLKTLSNQSVFIYNREKWEKVRIYVKDKLKVLNWGNFVLLNKGRYESLLIKDFDGSQKEPLNIRNYYRKFVWSMSLYNLVKLLSEKDYSRWEYALLKKKEKLDVLELDSLEFLKEKVYRIKLSGTFYSMPDSIKIFSRKSVVGLDLTFLEGYYFTRIVRVSSYFDILKKLYYKEKDEEYSYKEKEKWIKRVIDYTGVNSIFIKKVNFDCNNVNFGYKFFNVSNNLDMFVSNDQYMNYDIRYDSKLYVYRAEECKLSFVSNKCLDMVMLHIQAMNIENFLGEELDVSYLKFFKNEVDESNSKYMSTWFINKGIGSKNWLYSELSFFLLDKVRLDIRNFLCKNDSSEKLGLFVYKENWIYKSDDLYKRVTFFVSKLINFYNIINDVEKKKKNMRLDHFLTLYIFKRKILNEQEKKKKRRRV